MGRSLLPVCCIAVLLLQLHLAPLLQLHAVEAFSANGAQLLHESQLHLEKPGRQENQPHLQTHLSQENNRPLMKHLLHGNLHDLKTQQRLAAPLAPLGNSSGGSPAAPLVLGLLQALTEEELRGCGAVISADAMFLPVVDEFMRRRKVGRGKGT